MLSLGDVLARQGANNGGQAGLVLIIISVACFPLFSTELVTFIVLNHLKSYPSTEAPVIWL
jgi:hypothetical protein